MSEKFNGDIWRKIKNGVIKCIFYISIVLQALAPYIISLIFFVAIRGLIVSVCWNAAMTAMFGVKEITFLDAFILSYTLSSLRTDFIGGARFEYVELKEKILKINKNKKIAKRVSNKKIAKIVSNKKFPKIASAVLVVVSKLILILITIGVTMYSWNNILPQLLNVELVQINFGQAFGFTYLFHLVFGISKSNVNKSREDKDNLEEYENYLEEDENYLA